MWTEIFSLVSLDINILPGVSRALLHSKCCFSWEGLKGGSGLLAVSQGLLTWDSEQLLGKIESGGVKI